MSGPLVVSWFPTATPTGPALGEPELTSWWDLATALLPRRIGTKDGTCIAFARFELEPDGVHVRRLKDNLLARTAIALDFETSKETGEIPPDFNSAYRRIQEAGWSGVIYTSHSHRPEAPRYRIVLPLTEEIDHALPAPEVVAEQLGLLGVLDRSKLGAQSLFYTPSANPGELDLHRTEAIDAAAIDAAWMRTAAGALLAERQAEEERIAAAAHAEAAARRAAKIAAGWNPDDSLIEKLRPRFNLADVLRSHGYDKAGSKFRHPASQSGSYGADIRALDDGIPRVFSHNAGDPLHAANLPAWCAPVTALDVVDVLAILDFGGDRTRALRELAERFGLAKATERKALAKLMFRMRRSGATQKAIETAAFAEGERLGLTRDEVCAVSHWVVAQIISNRT